LHNKRRAAFISWLFELRVAHRDACSLTAYRQLRVVHVETAINSRPDRQRSLLHKPSPCGVQEAFWQLGFGFRKGQRKAAQEVSAATNLHLNLARFSHYLRPRAISQMCKSLTSRFSVHLPPSDSGCGCGCQWEMSLPAHAAGSALPCCDQSFRILRVSLGNSVWADFSRSAVFGSSSL
jgi:hypothetical protein